MRTFEFKDGKSNKFWNIELKGKSFTVTYGRIGTDGQTQTKEFADAAKAKAAHDKLVAEKLGKGYVETTSGAATAASSKSGKALENAILANPDDLAAHAAYADWLTEQGDPRGEFIQVQLALEDETKPAKERKELQKREQELLQAHESEWAGTWAALAAVGTPEGRGQLNFPASKPYGFVRGLLAEVTVGELTAKCARAFVRSPETRFVRRLFLGGWAYEEEEGEDHAEEDEDVDEDGGGEPSANILPRWPHFSNLRVFQLGWTSDEVYDDFCMFQCHLGGDSTHELVKRMPHLEELYLFAHGVPGSKIFGLKLPRLRVVQLYHSYDYALQELAKNASFTRLTHLLCHPHALDQEHAYIQLEDLRAVVRSPHLRNLTHLRLRLANFGDEGCEEIVKSGILQRLQVLDLRHGRISDAGARTLAACPDLKRLK